MCSGECTGICKSERRDNVGDEERRRGLEGYTLESVSLLLQMEAESSALMLVDLQESREGGSNDGCNSGTDGPYERDRRGDIESSGDVQSNRRGEPLPSVSDFPSISSPSRVG